MSSPQDEVAIQAAVRLAAYEKIVRKMEGRCPPLFCLTGLEQLFTGRGLEDLIRRPFINRCVMREKGGAVPEIQS